MSQTLKSIRIIKDFPKKGIAFYDISTILSSPSKFHLVVNKMAKEVRKINADTIVGIDSRGFIFASAVAFKLKKKLVMIRKKGKLPGETYSIKYKLEYGSNQLEVQKDMILKKDKVVIIDDLFTSFDEALIVPLVAKISSMITTLSFFKIMSFCTSN